AADADGDGIADSGLFRLPMGEINGVTYYGAVRIIDDNSAVNAAVAFANNSAGTGLWGDFFPTNVDLSGFLVNGAARMSAFNMTYRTGGSSYQPTMYDDNGVDRTPFAFLNAYDAMWMQLGRRLGNPGLADASH